MRNILSPEQVASVVADVTSWMAHMEQISDADSRDWQEATIHSVVQVAEIDEVECYLVILRFPSGDQSYSVPYLLKRGTGGLARLGEYSFFPPDFTHPTQERERNA